MSQALYWIYRCDRCGKKHEPVPEHENIAPPGWWMAKFFDPTGKERKFVLCQPCGNECSGVCATDYLAIVPKEEKSK